MGSDPRVFRVGIGYDIHRFKRGRALWLGGLRLPFPKGLEGHSDADALLHAITDALLGAAGLPDIGHYFPPSNPKIKGISSGAMLSKAVREAHRAGFRVVNVDSVVVCEAPKIGPHRDAMRQSVAKILGISMKDVQVKGKSNEGLDAIGRGQALAAHAVVLLKSSASPQPSPTGRGRRSPGEAK
jgi:2-C-methyl-D-erythritol 2,4-cyclodiphosphate synthase